MTYQQFEDSFYNVYLPTMPRYIREGQALMNYLAEVWLDEYQNISSWCYYDKTDLDCFYRDELIPNTLEHLKAIWPNDK